MALLIVGSIALDTVKTPVEEHEGQLVLPFRSGKAGEGVPTICLLTRKNSCVSKGIPLEIYVDLFRQI